MAGIPYRIFPLKRRKKRIRGFRRVLRVHRRRAAIADDFSVDWFQQSHRDVEKLGLAPWAVNEKPPLVIRNLWVGRLVADFQAWHQELAAHYPDFYLAVWIYEPKFGRSQLVAGIEERQIWSEGLFEIEADTPFPVEYQAVPGVAALRWTAYADVIPFWPDEFAKLGPWLTNRAH